MSLGIPENNVSRLSLFNLHDVEVAGTVVQDVESFLRLMSDWSDEWSI